MSSGPHRPHHLPQYVGGENHCAYLCHRKAVTTDAIADVDGRPSPDEFAIRKNSDPTRERHPDFDAAARLSVQAEGKTDLLKISFPHRDPMFAAEFAEALAAKQRSVLTCRNPFRLFDVQRKQLKEEVQKSRIESFSVAVSILSTIRALSFSTVPTTYRILQRDVSGWGNQR